MTPSNLERILEAIRSARRELETIEEEEDWFISKAVDRLRDAEYLCMKEQHGE